MKRYLVFATDLALVPLQGENPRGGELHDFDALPEAQRAAADHAPNWDRVYVFERSSDGEIERIEHYKHGNHYVGNVRRMRNQKGGYIDER